MFTLLLLILSGFTIKELLKKFRFMKSFFQSCPYTTNRHYDGKKTPGMHTIVLRSERPFSVLIGFDLQIPLINYSGHDPFGYATSDEKNEIIISTYLGTKKIDFQFLTSIDPKYITISSSQKDQHLTAHHVYPPHRWQRLGFFS